MNRYLRSEPCGLSGTALADFLATRCVREFLQVRPIYPLPRPYLGPI